MPDLTVLAEEVRAALDKGVESEDLLALVELMARIHAENQEAEDA